MLGIRSFRERGEREGERRWKGRLPSASTAASSARRGEMRSDLLIINFRFRPIVNLVRTLLLGIFKIRGGNTEAY